MKAVSRTLLLLCAFSLFFSSCRKDKDELSPKITVVSPYENQEFNVFDVIHVEATVTDNNKIDYINVSVTNENFIPVLSAIPVDIQAKETNISLNYYINDNFLESGKYYLHIEAYDGTNSKHSYTEIYIYESPKFLKHIIALTRIGSNGYNLIKIDSTFNTNLVGSGVSEHLASNYNSRHQQLYIGGEIMDDVVALNMPDKTTAFTIPCVQNPPQPYFTNISYEGKLLYVLFYDGNIKAYNNNGSIKYSSITTTAKYPKKIFRHENYLLIYQKDYVGSDGTIGVCYHPNSTIIQSLDVSYEIVDFLPNNKDNVFVFANNANQGKVYVYNIANNLSSDLYSISTDKIKSVCQLDENRFLIVLNNKIMLFKYNPLSLTTYISNITTKSIKFDKLNNILYIAESNRISSYKYPSATAINQVVLNNSILDFHLVFNK